MTTEKETTAGVDPVARGVVLVVDDDAATRELVGLWLTKAGMSAVEASTGEEALDAVARSPEGIDAILLDVMMPGVDGFEVLDRIKGDPRSSRIPILFLSASASEADVVRGVRAGAVDYLHKPFSGPILVTKVQAVVERGRAERALEDKLRSAEQIATEDMLTGLGNRRAFDHRLGELVAHSVRHGEPLSLLMLDIDKFKAINDELGHLAGDDALRHLAARLRGVIRAGDLAFRYGGEEFILLLQKCDRVGAAVIFERLRDALRSTVLQVDGGGPVPFSVSGGVASLQADNGFRFVNLVSRADAALYEAKRGGRDRVVVETAPGGPKEGPPSAHA